MAMKGSGGGGINSRQHVEVKQNLGRSREGVRPGYAGQLGQKQGSHITNRGDTGYRGAKMAAASPTAAAVPLGNALATNVGGGGPGKGRNVMASGSQQTWGEPNPGDPRPNPRHRALENE